MSIPSTSMSTGYKFTDRTMSSLLSLADNSIALVGALSKLVASGIDTYVLANQVGRLMKNNVNFSGKLWKALGEVNIQSSQDLQSALEQLKAYNLADAVEDKQHPDSLAYTKTDRSGNKGDNNVKLPGGSGSKDGPDTLAVPKSGSTGKIVDGNY